MERRERLSFGLPILGLVVTVPELVRLAGVPSPDPLIVGLAIILTVLFTARLVMLGLPYLRRR